MVLLISGAATVYAQNPLSKAEIFAQNVQQANTNYETLSADEKELCKWMGKNLAVQCARELEGMNRTELIPAEINPKDRLDVIDQSLAAAKTKAGLPEERMQFVSRVAYFRLAALWKAKADSVGKKTVCFPIMIQRDLNDDKSTEYLND